ncbi:GNAT family N-acetyltransferase [Nocardioides bruguierae]|uniref:GNAT family N-acetyltransferase n=1 Tax=Nocardioides bruguierae TaxID=2945102 RepID=UPI0020216927|nr:GNAT family N-acetyltransferase [Nocardioides bruguierae]MCL8027543.1 GNAT family N-acetyltransferase [Nocardioides bruguierae]
MTRSEVSLRDAVVEDALFLAEVWAGGLARGDVADQVAHLEVLVKTVTQTPVERLVVAEVAGEPAGAVLLRVAPVSPINPDLVVQAVALQVLVRFRRTGVGRRLLAAAADFADAHGVASVVTAAAATSREGNRFMARLGLAPAAVVRGAPAHQLRAKIDAQEPERRRGRAELRAQALVARRNRQRRAAERQSGTGSGTGSGSEPGSGSIAGPEA